MSMGPLHLGQARRSPLHNPIRDCMILRPSRVGAEPRDTQRPPRSAVCGARIVGARRSCHDCGCAGSGTAKGCGGQSRSHSWESAPDQMVETRKSPRGRWDRNRTCALRLWSPRCYVLLRSVRSRFCRRQCCHFCCRKQAVTRWVYTHMMATASTERYLWMAG
jgi:hypothetical protein